MLRSKAGAIIGRTGQGKFAGRGEAAVSDSMSISEFLRNEEVAAFVTRHAGELVSWEQFRGFPMPAGLSPETMWEVIEFVRLVGVDEQMPFSQSDEACVGESSWYSISSEMSAVLARLMHRGRTAGTLDARLAQYRCAYGKPPFLVADLSAAAARDGVEIDADAVIALAAGARAPATSAERLAANALAVLRTLDEYRDRAFDESLYGEIQSRLGEGCAALSYRPMLRPETSYNAYGGADGNDPLSRYDAEQKSWCLELISTHVNEVYQGRAEGIVAVVIACDLICEELPFPRWNGFMEIILRRLFFERIGMRALAFVSFSRALLDWELGLPSAQELPFAFGQAILHSRYGNNTTPYLRQLLQFLERGLDDLERETDAMVAQFDRCRAALAADARLNHRQQSLLMELVMNPSGSIDAATYERRYDVTLVTARADLKKLVQMGFLSLAEVGKKQVFSPVSHMEDVVAARSGRASLS